MKLDLESTYGSSVNKIQYNKGKGVNMEDLWYVQETVLTPRTFCVKLQISN